MFLAILRRTMIPLSRWDRRLQWQHELRQVEPIRRALLIQRKRKEINVRYDILISKVAQYKSLPTQKRKLIMRLIRVYLLTEKKNTSYGRINFPHYEPATQEKSVDESGEGNDERGIRVLR